MARLLRFANSATKTLSGNAAHTFAARYALQHFDSGAVYSFIPKNACTTMRYSLALANGAIAGAEDFPWIHANNTTFNLTLKDLVTAPYTFVILRDPFARLASVFLDKIVSKDTVAWQFRRRHDDAFEIDDLTFELFITSIIGDDDETSTDEHWRPQVDYLVYDDYDGWFRLEAFSDAIKGIEAATGIRVADARGLAGHGTDQYEMVEGAFHKTPAHEIAAMKRTGQCPSHRALYSTALAKRVAATYSLDLALYIEKFGADRLLFPQTHS